MQIHELNTYVGTPGAGDFLPIDNGEETKKIAAEDLGAAANPYPTYYGTSGTSAGIVNKNVTCPEFKLTTGAIIAVEFTYGNTSSSPALNVRSTGAKSIKRANGSTESLANAWDAGSVVLFVYDGASWILLASSLIPTVNESFSIARTGGAAGTSVDTVATKFMRNGKFASVMLVITQASEEIAAGANIFTGTLNTEKLRPGSVAAGLVGYIGQRPIIAQLNSSGNIVVRNTSATALTMGGSLYVYGTYLLP